jgi:hypothetical protein
MVIVHLLRQMGKFIFLKGTWDLIIAHPPCTDLCVSGARHFEKKRNNGSQRKSIEFFCKFLGADCGRIAIENPVGIISGDYIPKHFPDLADKHNLPRKQSQIIQPYEYGHQAKKNNLFMAQRFTVARIDKSCQTRPRFVHLQKR